MTEFYLIITLSYLLGSIPFGLLIGKLGSNIDIRKYGSGNIGATNVLRTMGKKQAIITLLLDMFKGVLAILMVKYFIGGKDLHLLYYTAFAAIIGHIFPVWLMFRGGKGVATTAATITLLSPYVGLMTIFTWIITFFISRISSLSAIIATIMLPIYAYWFAPSQPDLYIFCFAVSLIVLIRHSANIQRIIRGKEQKL
jgi:glycerol-3-phosphate acyltransferase PlsY